MTLATTLTDTRRVRVRGALWTTALSGAQALVALLAQLVLYAAAARTLPVGEFGIWTALATLGVWLTLSDLGINKAVMTGWARSSARSQLVSTGFFLQAAVAWSVAVGIYLVVDASNGIVRFALLPLLAVAPFAVARSILLGSQRGWVPALWDLSGSVLVLLLGLTVAPRAGLVGMAMISVSGICFSRLLGALWLRNDARPYLRNIDGAEAKSLWRSSRHFLAAQAADLLTLQGLPWVAILTLGPTKSGPFSSAARLVSCLPLLAMLFCNGLIPAYADATARGDHAWIIRTLRHTAIGAGAAAAASVLILMMTLQGLLQAWLGSINSMPAAPLFWLTLWAGVQCLLTPILAFLYGTGHAGPAARRNLTSALAGLAVGIVLAQQWGPTGLAAGLCVSSLFLCLAPLAVRSLTLTRAYSV